MKGHAIHTRPPADVGAPADQIDTPALVVDLDAYEKNLDRMAAHLRGRPVRLRPHAKTHKCPVIALRQIARGAVGVCCQKVSEAEAMVDGGVRNVLVSNEVVGAPKLARLAALARQAASPSASTTRRTCGSSTEPRRRTASACRCSSRSTSAPTAAASSRGSRPSRSPARSRRRAISASPGSRPTRDGPSTSATVDERREAIEAAISLVRETVTALGRAGLPCENVTGAGTGHLPFEAASGVYTELQAGSYPFMDADYKRVEGLEFENALFVVATVMSRPTADRAVVDAGLKALSVDSGMPTVHGRPDLEFQRAADEHGVVLVRPGGASVRLGDRLFLIPGHVDPTVNLYDWYVGIRGGRVEALWPITARGALL